MPVVSCMLQQRHSQAIDLALRDVCTSHSVLMPTLATAPPIFAMLCDLLVSKSYFRMQCIPSQLTAWMLLRI